MVNELGQQESVTWIPKTFGFSFAYRSSVLVTVRAFQRRATVQSLLEGAEGF